jgi:hypothetical protein
MWTQKCAVQKASMDTNINRLLYSGMYNMEIYCTSLYCIENPYWTRRRIVLVRIVLKTRIGLDNNCMFNFKYSLNRTTAQQYFVRKMFCINTDLVNSKNELKTANWSTIILNNFLFFPQTGFFRYYEITDKKIISIYYTAIILIQSKTPI